MTRRYNRRDMRDMKVAARMNELSDVVIPRNDRLAE
jgi:hypothetical protein